MNGLRYCFTHISATKDLLSSLARPRIGRLFAQVGGHAVVTKQLLAAPCSVEPHKFLVSVRTLTIALVAIKLSGSQSHEQDPLFR